LNKDIVIARHGIWNLSTWKSGTAFAVKNSENEILNKFITYHTIKMYKDEKLYHWVLFRYA